MSEFFKFLCMCDADIRQKIYLFIKYSTQTNGKGSAILAGQADQS